MKKQVKRAADMLKKSQFYNRAVLPKHYASALRANLKHGFPAKDLNVIGVTGTDGKTTTTTLIAQMLRHAGKKVAVITTISVDYGDGQGEQPSPSHMTTASVGSLVRMLEKIKQNNVDWLVLETSSHALSQYRVLGIPFSVAVMTNVTHEHLDYHGTFERYVAAKKRLFTLTSKNKNGYQTGVINADDSNAPAFIGATKRPVTYGINAGDVTAHEIKMHSGGSEYRVNAAKAGKKLKVRCNLPGRFNVYNSLAAVCVGLTVGLSETQIEQGIASLKQVAGRMNRLDTKAPFDVIVDYAVTPAALESVLKAARETTKGKVRIVFGATGDRDKEKRPIMGRIVAELADAIYLTDDETHTENPAAIQRAVYEGIQKAGGAGKTAQYEDRGEAIKQALRDSRTGDTVLITGLGHQNTRNMGGRDELWSDKEFVLKNLT